jgi:hypothetical protein
VGRRRKAAIRVLVGTAAVAAAAALLLGQRPPSPSVKGPVVGPARGVAARREANDITEQIVTQPQGVGSPVRDDASMEYEIGPTFRGHINFIECQAQYNITCSVDNDVWCAADTDRLRYRMMGETFKGNRLFINIPKGFACWNVKDSHCSKALKIFPLRSHVGASFDDGSINFVDLEGRSRIRLDVLFPFAPERRMAYFTYVSPVCPPMKPGWKPVGKPSNRTCGFPTTGVSRLDQPPLMILHGECRILPFSEGSQIK